MKLIELNPDWIKATDEHTYEIVDTLAEAQGVWFLCPQCFSRNCGVVGTHHILCWFDDRGVPDARQPRPGRWKATGTNFNDITLAPSINLPSAPCAAHFHVTNGEIT